MVRHALQASASALRLGLVATVLPEDERLRVRWLWVLEADETISDTATNCWRAWLQTTLQMLFKARLPVELTRLTKLLKPTI